MNTQERISTLLDIYERFGDNAQKALDFVNHNETTSAPSVFAIASDKHIPDGVYYLIDDGSHSTTRPCAGEISAIGIAHEGHYFSVPLDWNYGKSRLLKEDKYPEDEYCQREIEAIMDWDFVKHTNHLKELGLAINLKEGHYLPTMPVFGAMYKNRKCLNEALLAAGAEEIDFDEYFWFAQRYGVGSAWIFHGNTRYLTYDGVYSTFQCGAVSLWKPV